MIGSLAISSTAWARRGWRQIATRLDLDAVPTPAHQDCADADSRPAFSGDQPDPRAVGAAGYPLVRARLYCGTCHWLAPHSQDRFERLVLGRRQAAERRKHRRSAGLLRLRRHYWRAARQPAVLRSRLLLLAPARHPQNLGRWHGFPWRRDW